MIIIGREKMIEVYDLNGRIKAKAEVDFEIDFIQSTGSSEINSMRSKMRFSRNSDFVLRGKQKFQFFRVHFGGIRQTGE